MNRLLFAFIVFAVVLFLLVFDLTCSWKTGGLCYRLYPVVKVTRLNQNEINDINNSLFGYINTNINNYDASDYAEIKIDNDPLGTAFTVSDLKPFE